MRAHISIRGFAHPSVGTFIGRSVRPSIRPSVRPSVTFLFAFTRLYTPLCRSVRPSVRLLVRRPVGPLVRHTLLFFCFCGFWPHCSCPNDGVTSIMAPAHPRTTGVAMYPALLCNFFGVWDKWDGASLPDSPQLVPTGLFLKIFHSHFQLPLLSHLRLT